MFRRQSRVVRVGIGALSLAGLGAGAQGANIVLMRGGDAGHSQLAFGSGEVPAFLDGYTVTVSGGVATVVPVGTYAIPSATLTLPGIVANSHEGRLELSGDGHFINFGGYQAPLSSTTPRVTDGTGAGAYYQLGQLSDTFTYTSASLDTAVTKPQFVRASYSDNGTQAWVATKNPTGGLAYVSGVGGSTTTVALQNTTDWRDVKVKASQLFGGTGSSSVGVHGFYAIGTGEPTTGTPANTLLSNTGDNSVSGFSFQSLAGGTQPIGLTGANTLYVVGDPSSTPYIGKLYVDPAKTPISANELLFATRQTITAQINGPEAIVTQIDPENSAWVDLFVQNATGVYFAIDKSGTSSGDMGALTFTKILSTSNDTAFYGMTSSPFAVPEPASAGVLALGTLAGLIRRRPRA